jgi:hypothetical protein
MESGSDTYVASEANTVLLAEALRMPAGLLLEERERLFEQWDRRDVVGKPRGDRPLFTLARGRFGLPKSEGRLLHSLGDSPHPARSGS